MNGYRTTSTTQSKANLNFHNLTRCLKAIQRPDPWQDCLQPAQMLLCPAACKSRPVTVCHRVLTRHEEFSHENMASKQQKSEVLCLSSSVATLPPNSHSELWRSARLVRLSKTSQKKRCLTAPTYCCRLICSCSKCTIKWKLSSRKLTLNRSRQQPNKRVSSTSASNGRCRCTLRISRPISSSTLIRSVSNLD